MSRQEDFIEAGIAYRFEHGKPMAIGGDNFADVANEMNRTKPFEAGAEYGYQYALQHPHWIPVEERLPDEGQEVFAWNGTFKESYKCIYHDGLFEDYLGELGKGAVTHWMPIVPPRKEDRE